MYGLDETWVALEFKNVHIWSWESEKSNRIAMGQDLDYPDTCFQIEDLVDIIMEIFE